MYELVAMAFLNLALDQLIQRKVYCKSWDTAFSIPRLVRVAWGLLGKLIPSNWSFRRDTGRTNQIAANSRAKLEKACINPVTS